MFCVELIPDRISFRWAVRWDSGCVPVTRCVNSCRFECVCVCVPTCRAYGCGVCGLLFDFWWSRIPGLLFDFWLSRIPGLLFVFWWSRIPGFGGRILFTDSFLFLIIANSFSFLLCFSRLYAWSSDLDRGYSLVLKMRAIWKSRQDISSSWSSAQV